MTPSDFLPCRTRWQGIPIVLTPILEPNVVKVVSHHPMTLLSCNLEPWFVHLVLFSLQSNDPQSTVLLPIPKNSEIYCLYLQHEVLSPPSACLLVNTNLLVPIQTVHPYRPTHL